MTDYTLPNITIHGQTWSISFIDANDGLEALVPVHTKLLSIGNRYESLEENIPEFSMIMPENIKLKFLDDTGFFASLFTADCKIKILRDGEVEYYGIIKSDRYVKFNEYHVNGSDIQRTVSIENCSALILLRTILVEDVLTYLNDNYLQEYIAGAGVGAYHYLVNDLFASFMEYCLLTPRAYSTPEIANNDFIYIDFLTSVTVPWENLGIWNAGGTHFNALAGNYFGLLYDNAADFLVGCAASFGFIPKIYYDEVNSCFRLKLLTRRRQTYSTNTIPQGLKKANWATDILAPKKYYFLEEIEVGYPTYSWTTENDAGYDVVPPEDFTWDSEIRIYFPVSGSLSYLHDEGGELWNADLVGYIKYYDYNAGDWSTQLNETTEAFVKYFKAQRDYRKEFYTRTFKGFLDYEVTDVIVMNNGTTNKNYFINSHERNYEDKTETYGLIEI